MRYDSFIINLSNQEASWLNIVDDIFYLSILYCDLDFATQQNCFIQRAEFEKYAREWIRLSSLRQRREKWSTINYYLLFCLYTFFCKHICTNKFNNYILFIITYCLFVEQIWHIYKTPKSHKENGFISWEDDAKSV